MTFQMISGSGVPTAASTTVNPADGGIVGSQCITDPTSGAKMTVSQLHNGNQTAIPGGANSSFTTGVSVLQDAVSGLINPQREAGQDNVSSLGVVTGADNTAMQFKATCSQNLASGVLNMTLSSVTGTVGNVPWTIQQGSKLSIGTGGTQEILTVASVAVSTKVVTFTSVTLNAHNGSVTPFSVTGFTYNQTRDAAGENDGASGAGTAVAAEYEYNGGDPSGGNYDRARNINGKGLTTQTISSGSTSGATSLVLAANTGLQPGAKVLLYTSLYPSSGFEVVNVDLSYVPGSNTVPLASAQVNSTVYTKLSYDSFAVAGPTNNAMLPFGIGLDGVALTDPVSGLMYMARMAPGSVGAVSVSSDGTKPTYRYAGTFTPAATPTDMIVIQGSATKTGRVKRIVFGGTAGTAGTMPITVIRRSTANTGGTKATISAALHDINDVSATVVPSIYSVNPTSVGTAANNLGQGRLFLPTSAVAPAPLTWSLSTNQDKAWILRGASDFIAINGGASAVPSGGVIDYEIELEEDAS